MNEAMPSLRVLTWNHHGFIDRKGKRDWHRAGRCIGALAPDIAAFQEVDTRHTDPSGFDVARHIRGKVGDYGHEAWSISEPGGEYGQLLASRFPMEDRRVHDITVFRREPRKVLDARVRLPGASLRVIATHLGLSSAERQHQWERLHEILVADLSAPVILLGDLNEWRRRRLPAGLMNYFGGLRTPASFPSRFPLFSLDRIYCHPPDMVANVEIVGAAAKASDHLPVLSEIDVPSHRSSG